MTVIERFERQADEDVVILGNMIEHFMDSDVGKLFKLMIENLKTMEVQNSRNMTGNSDKILGRLEAYETILNDFQAFISRMRELQTPIDVSDPETPEATEQTTVLRGGEI